MALLWILLGLAIWFGFGYRGIQNIKSVVNANAGNRAGSDPWSAADEVAGRFGVFGGGVIWAISKIAQMTCMNYRKGESFTSWF